MSDTDIENIGNQVLAASEEYKKLEVVPEVKDVPIKNWWVKGCLHKILVFQLFDLSMCLNMKYIICILFS